MKRENVIGRANVEDTPELEAYYRSLEGEALGALWTVANEIEPWYPQPKSIPTLWKWKRVEPFVRRAPELVSAEKAARRVVMLVNPGRKEWSAAVGLLYTGVQVMNPGEFTSAHRHQASALRFVMEGRGAYTVVDGERLALGARDFVLTPNGTWHDHGNDSSEPVVWIDTLDWPLMEFLDAAWVDHDMPGAQGNMNVQPVTHTDGYSRKLYGRGGMMPTFVDHRRGVGHSPDPLFHYRGADVQETLHDLRGEKGDPYEGIKIDFVNPVTGEPVFRTLNYSAQLLRPGEETELKRETAGTYYVVIEGTGITEIGGSRFEWGHNDLFVVPNFTWRRHINTGKTDAIIYSVSDAALMRNIGQYYAQGRSNSGEVTQLVH
jgi:gentisate 1,2-dioxygenase